MPLTNTPTARAATERTDHLNDPLMLIGIFSGPEQTRSLVRTRSGTILELTKDAPQGDLILLESGDGWILVAEGRTLHRLVLA